MRDLGLRIRRTQSWASRVQEWRAGPDAGLPSEVPNLKRRKFCVVLRVVGGHSKHSGKLAVSCNLRKTSVLLSKRCSNLCKCPQVHANRRAIVLLSEASFLDFKANAQV